MTKQITRVWSFASDSNPNLEYETLQYTDGTTSCNCIGWTRRVAADGTARAVEQIAQKCKYDMAFWSAMDGLVDAVGLCVGR